MVSNFSQTAIHVIYLNTYAVGNDIIILPTEGCFMSESFTHLVSYDVLFFFIPVLLCTYLFSYVYLIHVLANFLFTVSIKSLSVA